jgi:hypothetical protein
MLPKMRAVWLALLIALGVVVLMWKRSANSSSTSEGDRLSHPPQPRLTSKAELRIQGRKHALEPPAGIDGQRPQTNWQVVMEMPDSSERHEALSELAAELVKTDQQEAARVASLIFSSKGHLDGDAYAFVMACATSIVAEDPRTAADWIKALPGELKLAASNVIAREWAKTDLAAVTQWSDQVLGPRLRTSIITAIGGTVETGDPQTAAAWAQNLSKAEDAHQHSKVIARLWGRADAQGVFGWASGLEDSPHKNGAFVSLAEVLAEKEPTVAGQWVEKFPAGDFRDQAVFATAQKWANTDPQAAVNWLSSLKEQRLLDAVIPGIASQWFQKDRAAATAWLQQSSLPDHVRNYVLQLNGAAPSPEILK